MKEGNEDFLIYRSIFATVYVVNPISLILKYLHN